MEIVRIGMVGARHGATLHLENLGSMRGQRVEIVGICSQSRESAEDCIEVICAAYLSAAEGRRVSLSGTGV